jgi:hypothetical protein
MGAVLPRLLCIASRQIARAWRKSEIGRAPPLNRGFLFFAIHASLSFGSCAGGEGWALLYRMRVSSFGPAGTPFEAPVGGGTSSHPPFVYNDRLGDSNAASPLSIGVPCRMSHNHRLCAGCRPGVFHRCGTTNQRGPCVCLNLNGAAEAGQTQISLSNGLALSGYGRLSAVPPYGG